MRQSLCRVGREGVLGNWKFTLLSNVLLLTMLPRDRSHSIEILDHFFKLSVCELPLLRRMGMFGITAILLGTSHSTTTPVAELVTSDLPLLKRSLFRCRIS